VGRRLDLHPVKAVLAVFDDEVIRLGVGQGDGDLDLGVRPG
jgi:hypothetical protein